MPQTSPLDVSAYRDANASDLPSMDSAATAQNPFARARWLQECMSAAGGWAQAPSALTINGVISTAGTPAQSQWHLGTYQLAANATIEGVIELWIHVSAFTSSTHLQLFARQPTGGRLALTPPTATGWTRYVLQSQTGGSQWEIFAQVDPAYLSATPALTIDSICFLQLPGVIGPAAFPVRYLPNLTANRPDDVDTVAAIDNQLTWVQQNYPRTLASHFLGVNTTASSATFVWKARRGPNTGNVDFWLYFPAAPSGALLEMFIDGTHSDPSNLIGTGATLTGSSGSVKVVLPGISSGLWIGFTLAGGWTANTASEVTIIASNAGGDSLVLEEVIAVEEDFPPAAFLVNDGGSPARMDLQPQRLILPTPSGLNANWPIIGSFWEQPAPQLQVQWNDRRTAMQNAIYHAIYRSQVLIFDRLSPGARNQTSADFGNLTDSGSVLPAPTMARWKHQTKRGAASAEVSIKASLSGMLYPNDYLVGLSLCVDGVYYGLAPVAPADLSVAEQWTAIGTYPVVEGQTHDVQLLAGFMTANGEAVGTSIQGALTIDGVQIVEVPPPAAPTGANAAFYALPPAASAAIPDNDAITGVSKSVVCPALFCVRHIRLFVQVTHPRPADLYFYLSRSDAGDGHGAMGPTQVTPTTIGSGQLIAYSDDVLLDSPVAPANPLSAFILGIALPAGISSKATWTLNVRDEVSGDTGTFDQFGIELT